MGLRDERQVTLQMYKHLFQLRKEEAALTSGELVWVNNTIPESVLSFLRKKDDDEILTIVNVSNRSQIGSVDLPARDYLRMKTLVAKGSLVGDLQGLVVGRVSFSLPAYGSVVAKKTPPLTK
jgi:glycosidase